jgi:hypothetical protein
MMERSRQTIEDEITYQHACDLTTRLEDEGESDSLAFVIAGIREGRALERARILNTHHPTISNGWTEDQNYYRIPRKELE